MTRLHVAIPRATLLGALVLAGLGCQGSPFGSPLAEGEPDLVRLAESDYETLRPFHQEEPPDPTSRLRRTGDLASQAFHKYAVAQSLTMIMYGPLAIAADSIVTAAGPLMGSHIQDAIEDTLHDLYRLGPNLDRTWRWVPPVPDPVNDLHARDPDPGPPATPRLVVGEE